MTFIGNLNFVAIAVVGGLRVSAGAITIGDIQAFIQYSRQFTQPLTQMASMANVLQSGIASAERVFELLDAPEQVPDPDPPVEIGQPRGRVEFEHVWFSYDPDIPLITDLSLVAEPGRTVAIVGPTGAGKTTLVNLIMRFYDLDRGRITLDGVDIAAMSRRDLRAGHRHGPAGHVAVRRDDPGQHRLRRPDRQRGADPRCGPCRLRRPVRALPARRVRHGRRRRGQPASARARSSCSRSPGPSSPTRPSSSSTRPPARSTPAPRS